MRQERLVEAVQIMRMVWQEGQHSYREKYFVVENARIYTLPGEPPPIMIAAAGLKSTEIAAKLGDGLITTEPDAELAKKFRERAGQQKPCYGEVHVALIPMNAKRSNSRTKSGQSRAYLAALFGVAAAFTL